MKVLHLELADLLQGLLIGHLHGNHSVRRDLDRGGFLGNGHLRLEDAADVGGAEHDRSQTLAFWERMPARVYMLLPAGSTTRKKPLPSIAGIQLVAGGLQRALRLAGLGALHPHAGAGLDAGGRALAGGVQSTGSFSC